MILVNWYVGAYELLEPYFPRKILLHVHVQCVKCTQIAGLN